MKPMIFKLFIAFSIFMAMMGVAHAHSDSGSLKEVNGYLLGLNIEQATVGDEIPIEVHIEHIADSVAGLIVQFTISNGEAGINETKTATEREAGHYFVKQKFASPGIYEIQISTTIKGEPIASTFEINSLTQGCKPGQAQGCSPADQGIQNIEYYIAGAALVLIVASLAFFGIKKKNWVTAGVLVGAVIVTAIIGYSLYVTILSGAASSGIITCTSEGKCFYTAHMHAYIPITVCGEDYRLPIEVGDLQKAHTHEEKNVAHWHDRLAYDKEAKKFLDEEPLKLKSFFEQIEIPFSSSRIGDAENNFQCPDGSTAVLKMVVNGKNNTEFGDYRWHDKDVIVIVMDGRSIQEVEQELKEKPIPFPVTGRE